MNGAGRPDHPARMPAYQRKLEIPRAVFQHAIASTSFEFFLCSGVFVEVPFAAAGFLFVAGSMLQVSRSLSCHRDCAPPQLCDATPMHEGGASALLRSRFIAWL